MSASQNSTIVSSSLLKTPSSAGNPACEPRKTGSVPVSAPNFPDAKSPPFSAYLQIVSLTTTITVSVSISASQGLASGGNFFGVDLSDPNNDHTLQNVIDSSNFFSWSAAASAVSLMITLVLQLALTDNLFVQQLTREKGAYCCRNVARAAVGAGSWIALGLQGAAIALIAQALKIINHPSGIVIQVNFPVSFGRGCTDQILSGVFSPSACRFSCCTR